jgi:hypothetical protein
VQARGQFVGPRHRSAVNKHRNYVEARRHQGRLDLDAYPIVGIIKSTRATLVTSLQPGRADQDQRHPTARQYAPYLLPEIDPGTEAVHVHKYTTATEAAGKRVMQAPGNVRGVVASITDEDRLACHATLTPEVACVSVVVSQTG